MPALQLPYMAQRDKFQRSQALIFTASSKPKKAALQQNGEPQKTSKKRQKGVAFLRMKHLKHRNATLFYRNATPFLKKEWLKKQKIADLSFCFEFQVVVAVVGFLWHSWGNAKMADLRSGNAFKSLPQRNALISIFNGFGFYFSILHRLWICHATLMI